MWERKIKCKNLEEVEFLKFTMEKPNHKADISPVFHFHFGRIDSISPNDNKDKSYVDAQRWKEDNHEYFRWK